MKRKPCKTEVSAVEYVEKFYLPGKAERGAILTRATQRYYRSAAIQFDECHGQKIAMQDIDDAKLAKFRYWLLGRGYKNRSASDRVSAVRSMARDCLPDRWPIEHGRVPLSWQVADVQGTLEQIFHSDYLPERTRIGSAQTIRQYGRCLRLFGEYLERPATLDDLTDKMVGSFLRWLVRDGGVRAVTANGYVKQVKALWNWAAKKRLVPMFPTVDDLPVAKPMPMAWPEDELRLLVEHCRGLNGTIGEFSAADVWLAFHLIIWDGGERTGAMLELRWDWLDWKTGVLAVPGDFRKGGRESMLYPLKPETVRVLRRFYDPKDEIIFAMLLPMWRFYARYKRLVIEAGLQYVPHKTGPQKMRRTYASFIEAAGGNATRALKHTSRRVTEESYLDPRIAETHHENERLFSLET